MSERRDLPYALRPGDTISAVLPSGPPDLTRFDAGVMWLESQGFKVRVAPGARDRVHRYTAGTVQERGDELCAAYADPSVRALYCGRGGYGAMHLLDRFLEVVATNPPKLVIGFSDVTALGCALWQKNVPWLHAPLLTTVASEPAQTQAHLLALATGDGRRATLSGAATIRDGKARGRLIGGSLSLLSALCGTPYMPDLKGAVLFLEDVGERPYRLDRMWMQLKLSGALAGVAAVILGHFTACDAPLSGRAPEHAALSVMSELARALDVPSASGFAFGHEAPNFAVPFGAMASFDAEALQVVVEEEIVV
jgi:muramoyltetrapeptide carboxypeptidase